MIGNEQSGAPRELVRNVIPTTTGLSWKYPDPLADGSVPIGTTIVYPLGSRYAANGLSPHLSVACGVRVYTGGVGGDIVACRHYVSEASNQGWEIQSRGDAPRQGINITTLNNNALATYAMRSGIVQTDVAGYHDVGFSTDGTTRRMFMDGVADTSDANGAMATVAAGSADDQIIIGNGTGTGCSYLFIWNRIVTAREFALIAANPFEFIIPPGNKLARFTDVGSAFSWHTSVTKVWK